MKTTAWVTVAAVCVAAASSCSSTSPGSADSGTNDAGGSGSSGSTSSSGTGSSGASSGSNSGGSSNGSSNGGSSSGVTTGCADGGIVCPQGTQCCTGVPYPPEGACYPMCDLQSDRNTKRDIELVDGDQILEQVAHLSVSEWSYKVDPAVRHVGPMAQDFHASFGLGRDDRSIDAVDEIGVTLSAVQALNQHVAALEREMRELRDENARLREDRCESSSARPGHATPEAGESHRR